ncbi:MAG: retropepsin-like domain-containing protein [Bacteroidales bacterium]|jgi:hypothetical protein|nr:retropepsin-like domain-containing protein [Bacteroidales bacterium]
MKKNLFLLLFLLLSLSGYSQQLEWIPFKWVGGYMSRKYFDKAALFVPVNIDNLPEEFMQFDLGASTCLYENSMKHYWEENKLLREKLDTTNTFMHNGKDAQWLNNINLKLGKVSFNGINIFYYKNYGMIPQKRKGLHWTSKPHYVGRIGTLGADLFQDKVLVIDYPNTRIAVTDSLPDEYKDLPYERIKLDLINRAIIPFRINGKEEWLLFDTGSSSTQFNTSKEQALEISDSIVIGSRTGSSWGNLITTVQFKVNKPVEFAGKVLENPIVSYITDERYSQSHKRENIWGVTGNAFFWDNMVIIDYKNKTFRVK